MFPSKSDATPLTSKHPVFINQGVLTNPGVPVVCFILPGLVSDFLVAGQPAAARPGAHF